MTLFVRKKCHVPAIAGVIPLIAVVSQTVIPEEGANRIEVK